MNENGMIQVLIVDDHAMVRSGLTNFIGSFDWVEAVGEASNGAEAVEFCAQHDVDVVLMDMIMPVMDGTEATRRIISLGKSVKVIILTSFHEQNMVEQALRAGATSYLLKNVSADELAAAIRSANSGLATLAPEATEALIEARHREVEANYHLTDREEEVLALLAAGASNREISEQLSLSVATIKFHLTNIFTKLGARNRVEAVTIALEHGLVGNSH